MTRAEQNKILDDKIESNVNQYKVHRLNAEISAFSSGDLNKYEFLKRIDLNYKPNFLDKARFEFSPLGRTFNEGLDKTIPNYQEEGVIKLLKEIRDNLAGGMNIKAGLVIPPGPQGPPGPPPSPSPTNITTPSTSPPTTPSLSPHLTLLSPSSSLTNVTPLGPRRSRIPRPSSSQSDLDLKDLFRSRPDIDLDKLKSNLDYSDILNKIRSRPNIDVDKHLDELRSQEPVSTSPISAQDEERFPKPKIKHVSNKTFIERPFQTPLSSMPSPTIRQRKDQYDDKNKEPSKIPKPSKSLKSQGIGAGEWASYAIKLNNIENEKKIIDYYKSKLRDLDFSSKEALETSNRIEKIKNRIPKLEQKLREYYEDLTRRDREYRMSRK